MKSSVSSPPPARRRPRPTTALLLACTVLVSSGCAVANSAGGDAGQADGRTLRVVLTQEPSTLEPCEASLTGTGVVVRSNITEPLVERDPDSGDLRPLLATGWTQTGPRTWSFDTRSGVTFQNGEPFTAEDAAFSIDRAVNSDLACNVEGYVFGDDDLKVKAVDDNRLTVTTAKPDPILPLRLSFVEIVPRTTDTKAKVRVPVGTGPYAVRSWQTGTAISLSRYDDYWGKAPAFPRARYVWRSDASVRAAMIDKGEAEIAVALDSMEAEKDTTAAYPNNETTALRLDGREAPLDDLRVRRAIDLGVDRQGIIDALLGGLAEPAGQLVPPGVVGHNDAIEPTSQNVAEARSLVKEAKADGVPTGRTITLVARNGMFSGVSETAEALQYQMEQIGLSVRVRMADTATQLQYQLRPLPKNVGPIALLIMHGNQAGDAAFTTSQYLLSDGPQSAFGTKDLDRRIAGAGLLSGEKRQKAFADLLARQNETVVQYTHIAHMTGLLGLSPSIRYEPNSATGDELRLAEVGPAEGAKH
ncbi:ABC transporter substrate-binding protein [Streptomyces aurantiacus]|uniref:Peptide ABC transporter substrate-binding protein n=1 Tax=Streptomyces aurantiacus TaxID=47760 RepID=A0A7G1PAH0_9ACTN|nr:ABC transporter substrate-binding protein [Streptomyces aurantiacus]BCL32369.1 peptide ABC transporter substrate-binding protein [Streptomyces aurantiacus]